MGLASGRVAFPNSGPGPWFGPETPRVDPGSTIGEVKKGNHSGAPIQASSRRLHHRKVARKLD